MPLFQLDVEDHVYLFETTNRNPSAIASRIRRVTEVHNEWAEYEVTEIDGPMTIYPYFDDDLLQWVFDDADKGLEKEQLIQGIDTMLDHVVREKGIPHRRLGVAFAATPIPQPDVHLRLLGPVDGNGRTNGNWYRWDAREMDGWLCPELYRYFDEAPEELFLKVLSSGVRFNAPRRRHTSGP